MRLLDLTLGAKKIDHLHGRELAMDYASIDPIEEPIPVRPGSHYHMGGGEGRRLGAHVQVPSLCAAEVASVHGADALGGATRS